MAIESILAQIDAEIERLTQVRTLLATGVSGSMKLGAHNGKTAAKTRSKRVLSPEARKRIADAQRKRWAAQKAKGK